MTHKQKRRKVKGGGGKKEFGGGGWGGKEEGEKMEVVKESMFVGGSVERNTIKIKWLQMTQTVKKGS